MVAMRVVLGRVLMGWRDIPSGGNQWGKLETLKLV